MVAVGEGDTRCFWSGMYQYAEVDLYAELDLSLIEGLYPCCSFIMFVSCACGMCVSGIVGGG